MIATVFGIFFTLLLIGVPIALSLGISATFAFLIFGDFNMAMVVQKFFGATNSFGLMAIPFFLIAGGLLGRSGLSRRLVNFVNSLFGWLPGGLIVVVFFGAAFFGAISGSAVATVATIGTIMLPSLQKEGYPLNFSLSAIAICGYLGVIVPPSIPMILYGLSTGGVSVGDMFLGGFIPGFILAGGMSIYGIYYGVRHKDVIKRKKFVLKDLWESFKGAIWAIFMPVIVLGGIYGGIFTPTEAAAVAVLYGLLVSLIVYRDLALKDIFKILQESVLTSSMIMFVIATASFFAHFLAMENIPTRITEYILGICNSPSKFWLIVMFLLFIVGMVMDTPPAIIILSPLLAPIAEYFGIDPIVFGIIMIVNLGIGMVTPPVGMNLFVAAGLCNADVKEVININLLIFIFLSTLIMILLILLPDIIMFIPNLAR